jgi:hypothetical protein
VVGWETNTPSDASVEYGLTAEYGAAAAARAPAATSHSVAIEGLAPGTLHHYRVRSRGPSGAVTVSGDMMFVTGSNPAAPVVTSVSMSTGETGAPVLSWTTDRPGDSQVEYGPTPAYGAVTKLDSAPLLSHAAALPGLPPGTPVHYRVRSTDAAGNLGVSPDQVLTPPDTAPPVVVLMNPASGAMVSSTVTLSANAVDNAGVAAVQFRMDGADVGPRLSSAPFTLTWDSTQIPDGTHLLAVSAWDAAQNVSTSTAVAVTVANHPAEGAPAASSFPAASASEANALAPQKFLSPARADGINDAAFFGPGAKEVRVFDRGGRQVYRAAAGAPGAGLSWNGRDGSGSLVSSGLYLAMVTTFDGRRLYQRFAVVR